MKIVLDEQQKQKLEILRLYLTSHPFEKDKLFVDYCKENKIPVYLSTYNVNQETITYCICPIATHLTIATFDFMSVAISYALLNDLILCKEEVFVEDGVEVMKYIKVIKTEL